MSLNVVVKARASRLLGRCHAALGDHMLSVAALDAAMQVTRTGELIFSESLTARTRALVGKEAGWSSPHWSEYAATQRLLELTGRMESSENNRALAEKLLLHGIRD